ncbi:uncharacterized protein LOC135811389 [Sycon ciliatum]|uniref:uncharacterized protein LOC135811389 n=1 Tax=Sycon ciliatum TaxID=27933 RepID=UPI0031F6C770
MRVSVHRIMVGMATIVVMAMSGSAGQTPGTPDLNENTPSDLTANDTATCMTQWLRHSFPDEADESRTRYERLLREFSPPVDQLTLSKASPLLLALVFGGAGMSSKFSRCSDGQCQHPSSCQHGGTCVYASVDGNTPQLKQYKCQCRPGYAGRQCEKVVSACITRRPCKHGARCERIGSHRFVCHCPPFYYGKQCQHRFGIEELGNMTSSLAKISHRLRAVETKSAQASQRNANTITSFLQRLEAHLNKFQSEQQAAQGDLNKTLTTHVQKLSDLTAKDRTLEAMFTSKLGQQETKITGLATGQLTMQSQLNQRMDNGLASQRQQQTALMNSRHSQLESRMDQNMNTRLEQLKTELNQRMDDKDSHLQAQVVLSLISKIMYDWTAELLCCSTGMIS